MDAVVDFGSGRAGNRYRHRRVLRGEEEEDGKGQIIANAKKSRACTYAKPGIKRWLWTPLKGEDLESQMCGSLLLFTDAAIGLFLALYGL